MRGTARCRVNQKRKGRHGTKSRRCCSDKEGRSFGLPRLPAGRASAAFTPRQQPRAPPRPPPPWEGPATGRAPADQVSKESRDQCARSPGGVAAALCLLSWHLEPRKPSATAPHWGGPWPLSPKPSAAHIRPNHRPGSPLRQLSNTGLLNIFLLHPHLDEVDELVAGLVVVDAAAHHLLAHVQVNLAGGAAHVAARGGGGEGPGDGSG